MTLPLPSPSQFRKVPTVCSGKEHGLIFRTAAANPAFLQMVTITTKPVHLIFYMIKVWYPQRQFPQRKYLRVDLINSTAQTADASIELWCATVTTTVEMAQTRKTVPVAAMSWHAPMGSASITFGNVMVKMTVKMARTSWIAMALIQVVTNKLLNKQRQQKKILYFSVSSFKNELLIADTFTFPTVGQSVHRGFFIIIRSKFFLYSHLLVPRGYSP